MSDRDYYEILGLTPGADGAMVDQAYWHLARKYQALAATNARAQHLLDELNEAYGVVGNPVLRRQYDAFRDDVLVQRGMIRPVRSKAKRTKAVRTGDAAPSERRGFSVPSLSIRHWRTYASATVIVALALAGAWQGVNIVFVAMALAVGLAVSLTPAVTQRVSQINISMPSVSLPSMQMPSVQIPSVPAIKLSLPSLSDGPTPTLRDYADGPSNDDSIDADELRASTAKTIARWRASVGLRASMAGAEEAPDTTLVDIVESEREIEAESEPLTAVIDILRGSHRAVPHSG